MDLARTLFERRKHGSRWAGNASASARSSRSRARFSRTTPDAARPVEARELKRRSKKAVDIAVCYGGIDGAHHKAWVIDQMARALAGKEYAAIVRAACAGEDGPDAGAAARDAWDAACKKIEPTKVSLQASALVLIDKMIALSEAAP